jgi:hypothetical protein
MVRLGSALWELTHMRVALALSVAAAVLFAVGGALHVTPGSSVRAQYGAQTEILVDEADPSVLDTRYGTQGFTEVDNGADLLASLMVTTPVNEQISSLAGIPLQDISFSSPETPITASEQPTTTVPPARGWTLTVAPDPSVPIIDVYAQGPTRAGALRLANAAVTGLGDHTASVPSFQLSVTQLGHGRLVYSSGGTDVAGIALRSLLVFLVCAAASLGWARARRSWTLHTTGLVSE